MQKMQLNNLQNFRKYKMAQGVEHKPTTESRELVKQVSGFGLPQDNICALVGLSDSDTLLKHYREEIALGKAQANVKVGKTLFNKVMDGDTTAAIWWSKTQMRWKDTTVTEHAGSVELKNITRTIIDV